MPRAILGSGVMIAAIYIIGTIAVLGMLQSTDVDPKSGVFQAITIGSTVLKVGLLGIVAAMLVSVGNAGGVGSTVAGIARVPFVVGIDRYLPAAFGKIHPKWKTPYISILVQAGISGLILLVIQINETANSAYQILVDAAVILYFIPFLYMYAAAIKLSYRKDRAENPAAVLIPGGKVGVWIAGGLGFLVVAGGIALSVIPPGEAVSKIGFEAKLLGATLVAILIGLALYFRGARQKSSSGAELKAGRLGKGIEWHSKRKRSSSKQSATTLRFKNTSLKGDFEIFLPEGWNVSKSSCKILKASSREKEPEARLVPDCMLECVGSVDTARSGCATDSINGALLHGLFCGQGEARLGCAFAGKTRCHISAHGGAVFEAVAGAAADQPNIFEPRMAIDQKISIGSIFVLADARFDDGSIFQGGETLAEIVASGLFCFGSGSAVRGVGIDRRAMAVDGDFHAAIFQVGHAVNFIAQANPGGHRGRCESSVACRRAEKENFLAGGENALAQN